MKKAVLAALVACAGLGCSGGLRLPGEVTFEGVRLQKATDWSSGGVSGVVFVPPGEKLETASLQVGILASKKYSSGSKLHTWLMEQYHGSPTTRWYESATADEACKVGVPQASPPRPFVALHVCRTGSGASACAEADERLRDDVAARCSSRGSGCWDEVCTQKWDARRAALEALVNEAVGPR